MYSVVGCRNCHALWIVEKRPETTRCPRCRRRHQFKSLRAFAETETSEAAARVRSSMLAERADDGEFVDPNEIDIESVGVDEVEFLAASGVDTDAVAAARDRAEGSTERSRSQKQVLLDGVDELDEPTRANLVEYATAAGIPESRVERAIEKLHHSGEITRANGAYREL
jgi:DNA replicative helicase MCM subunit Mcm2 (Cdc46/Mcm family)